MRTDVIYYRLLGVLDPGGIYALWVALPIGRVTNCCDLLQPRLSQL